MMKLELLKNYMDMKTMFLFLAGLCVAAPAGWGQTMAAEEKYLNEAVTSGRLTQAEATYRAKIWKEIRGEYPAIPYDTATKSLSVDAVISFPGVTKAAAFKRVKEWAALSFGKLDEVLEYEDMETGKIILEGHVPVSYSASYENVWGKMKSYPDTKDLTFSMVITLKDGKAKVEYENLMYRYWIYGLAINGVFYPRELVHVGLQFGFPLISGDPGSWRGTFDLIRQTIGALKATGPSIEKHIRDVANDYGF